MRAFIWAAFVSLIASCGGSSPGAAPDEPSPSASPRSASFDRLSSEADARVDTEVTFDAFVIGTAAGCLDVLCETESGCCGTCTGEAYFAATPDEDDLDRALFMFAAEGAALGEGFGACQDDDACNIVCNPSAGAHVTVTGVLRRTQGMLTVEVRALRPAQ